MYPSPLRLLVSLILGTPPPASGDVTFEWHSSSRLLADPQYRDNSLLAFRFCYLCGVYGKRDIKMGHSSCHTDLKN